VIIFPQTPREFLALAIIIAILLGVIAVARHFGVQ
jgi:hypothetical protein